MENKTCLICVASVAWLASRNRFCMGNEVCAELVMCDYLPHRRSTFRTCVRRYHWPWTISSSTFIEFLCKQFRSTSNSRPIFICDSWIEYSSARPNRRIQFIFCAVLHLPASRGLISYKWSSSLALLVNSGRNSLTHRGWRRFQLWMGKLTSVAERCSTHSDCCDGKLLRPISLSLPVSILCTRTFADKYCREHLPVQKKVHSRITNERHRVRIQCVMNKL